MDYHVRPLGKTCAATGEPLSPGDRVISVLVERNGELVRLDYAARNWTAPPEGTVGQWTCQTPPEESTGRPIDPAALFAFFEQIIEDANPAQEQLAYVLALSLLQRRRLLLEGARVDGDVQYLQLCGSRGEGPYEVRDQQLSDDQMRLLQAELRGALQAEWSAA